MVRSGWPRLAGRDYPVAETPVFEWPFDTGVLLWSGPATLPAVPPAAHFRQGWSAASFFQQKEQRQRYQPNESKEGRRYYSDVGNPVHK